MPDPELVRRLQVLRKFGYDQDLRLHGDILRCMNFAHAPDQVCCLQCPFLHAASALQPSEQLSCISCVPLRCSVNLCRSAARLV